MYHTITVLTVSTVIPVGDVGAPREAPWGMGGRIQLDNPTLTTITISDDDDMFRSGLYTPDETDQTLVEDAVFGTGPNADFVPAGTRMSNFVGSIITSDDNDSFYVVFPRSFEAYDVGTEYGGHQSVLIFPVPNAQGIAPVFDLSVGYRMTAVRGLERVADGVAWPVIAPALCFAQDTMIETPFGARPVQDLKPRDLLQTLDRGAQPVLWIGHRLMGPRDLDLRPDQRPIRIAAHALGAGHPTRDLIVSPQHRVLIGSRIAERISGHHQVLVAARHLAGLPGVTVITDTNGVAYWHVLMADHNLLLANGAWAESLLPRPMALRALGAQNARRVIALTAGTTQKPARHLLPGRQARRLAQRHGRNQRALLDA
ncbi:Hint domain-containing protein [Paracoccus sp. Ld10]|uniref:Hint domain-containing protein n=1 Tax=Paracoccus sp. Ld10 TaxID=649158 RepID=UPI003868A324